MKTIKIIFICLVSVIILMVFLSQKNTLNPTSNPNNKEEILNLETEKLKKDEGNRYNLLRAMTTDKYAGYANYERSHLYQLDDSDPSSLVMIGTYNADDYGKNGGIIMLKKLDNGRYSIYWEIKSPFLWNYGALLEKKLEDINGDGFKELITQWSGNMSNIVEEGVYHKEYWVLALSPSNKTYKVLNPIVDKDKNLITNFDFQRKDSGKVYFNRFQSNSYKAFERLVSDVDNDGVSEIVIDTPALECFGELSISPAMMGNECHYNQIYKWDGSKYFLWKETTDLVGDQVKNQ